MDSFASTPNYFGNDSWVTPLPQSSASSGALFNPLVLIGGAVAVLLVGFLILRK